MQQEAPSNFLKMQVLKRKWHIREVEKAREIEKEPVGQVLGLVENDEGNGAALVDHVDERLLDVRPQLAASMRRANAKLEGERAIELEWRDRGVTEVEDEVIGAREIGAEIAKRGGLADARLGGENAEARIVDELPEGTLDACVAGALVEERLALGALG